MPNEESLSLSSQNHLETEKETRQLFLLYEQLKQCLKTCTAGDGMGRLSRGSEGKRPVLGLGNREEGWHIK